MKKRILAGLLMAAMLCFVLMVTASATDETYYIGASGSGNYYATHAEGWKAAVEASMNSSTCVKVVLSADWEAAGGSFGTDDSAFYKGAIYVPSGANIILDLNGYKIDRGLTEGNAEEYGSVIYVEGSLTITDNRSGSSSYTITDPTTSEDVTITTGLITGGYVNGGGDELTNEYDGIYGGAGIFVHRGSLTLNGGTIAGNSVISHTAGYNGGGGVFVYGDDQGTGAFVMNGGVISYNCVGSSSDGSTKGVGGGGVLVGTLSEEYSEMLTEQTYATFTMNDGKIEHNLVDGGWGGGVSGRYAELNLLSGSISYNTNETTSSGSGGGVNVGISTQVTLGSAAGNGSAPEIIQNSCGRCGGGIYVGGSAGVQSSVVMYSGTISKNEAGENGGAIYIQNSATSFTMLGGTISGNKATGVTTDETGDGGAVYANGGSFNMTDGNITGNTAASRGGAIFLRVCAVTMSGGTLAGNSAGTNGGAVAIATNGEFTLSGGTIGGDDEGDANTAKKYGGGIWIGSGKMIINGGSISGNKAISGGGIYVISTVTMDGGTISGNQATDSGGGVFIASAGTFTLTGGTIGGTEESDANKAKNGGGIYASGTMTVSGGEISGNKAENAGGGIYSGSRTLTMSDGVISSNAAGGHGGGIYSISTLEIIGGTITTNKAAGLGGGVFFNGSELKMSKNPVITGNIKTANNAASNVHLYTGKTITLSGALTSGAEIGVTTATSPTSGNPVPITGTDEGGYYQNSYQYFVSDAQSNNTTSGTYTYVVQANETGKYVELAYTINTVYYIKLEMDDGVTANAASPVQVVGDEGAYPYSITLTADEGYLIDSVTIGGSTTQVSSSSTTLSNRITGDATMIVTTAKLNVTAEYTGDDVKATYRSAFEVNINSKVTATYTISEGTTSRATIESYTVASGTLPAGLSLSSAGVLSGTPTATTEDAGTTVTITATAANGTSDTFYLTIIVSPADLSDAGVTLSESSYTYDGLAKTPTVTVTMDGYTLVENTDYTVGYSDNTNVGTDATVTITGINNYTGTAAATFEITAADATVTAPTAKSLTYNGEEQALVNAGSATNGTMYYSTDGQSYSTDIPTATDAGTYTVYYMVKGEENYGDTNEATVSVTIAPAKVTITANSYTIIAGSDLPSSAELGYTVSGLIGSDQLTTAPTLTYTVEDANTAGTYAITASGAAASANYTISYVSGTLTIQAAEGGYNITGLVQEKDSSGDPQPLSGATVKLMKGNTVYAFTTTDSNGVYSFGHVVDGEYNIVVVKGGNGVDSDKTKTSHAVVNSSDVTMDNIILPAENISSVVTSDTAIVVAGLDDLAESGEYNPTDAEAVMLELKATSKTETEIPTAAEKIQALSGSRTMTYYDLTINHYIDNEPQTNVTDTDPYVLEIIIPYTTSGRSSIVAYRYHDGSAETLGKLSTRPNDSADYTDGTYYVGSGFVVIYATKFSTYAIGSIKTSSTTVPAYEDVTYSITMEDDTKNGTITLSDTEACEGDAVTITVTPDRYYALASLVVTNSKGRELDVTDNGDGTYTFTMPASKVTIEATFEMDEDFLLFLEILAGAAASNTQTNFIEGYTDLDASAWYAEAVNYVVEQGLMTGTSATTFEPNTATNRAMLVTILYRLEGEPAVTGTSGFTDVVDGAWYADAVTWAAQNGIVNGLGDGQYGVYNTLTREQMAAILYRYAQYKGYDVSVGASTNILSYTDTLEISEWAMEAMQWANGAGLITGVTESTLAPQSDSTRAVMATILMRFCENVAQ